MIKNYFLKILNAPHPFIYNWLSVVLPGGICVWLIVFLAPFGIDSLVLGEQLVLAGLLGLIASLSIFLTVNALKWLIPQWMQEEHWTVGKEIGLVLVSLIVIVMGIFGAFLVLGISNDNPVVLFQKTAVNTVLISVFPIIILVLFEQYTEQKKQLRQAREWEEQLKKQQIESIDEVNAVTPAPTILFKSESGKPIIQLPFHEIAFLKSEGNYVEIYYSEEDIPPTKVVIRNKLKSFIQELPKEQFFHCHKSYVINSLWIRELRGNARNYELRMKDFDYWIPVSRAKAQALADFLKSE